MKTSAYYLAGIWMLAFLIGGCKGQTESPVVNTPAASATAAMTETATPAPTATSPADATATALQATAQALATAALSESTQLTEAVRAESGLDGIGVQFEFEGEAVWAVFFAAGPQGFNALTDDAAGVLTPMERQAEPLTAERLYEPWLWSAIREAGASPEDVTGLELVTWNMPDETDLRRIQIASYQTAPTTQTNPTNPTVEMVMRVFDTAGREYVVHLPEALRREMQARLATAGISEPLPPLTLAQDVAFSPEAVDLLKAVMEQGEAMAFGRDEEGNLLVRNLATGEILLIESERGSGEMILYQAWLEANPEAYLQQLEAKFEAATEVMAKAEILVKIHELSQTRESAERLAEFLNEEVAGKIVNPQIKDVILEDELIKFIWDTLKQKDVPISENATFGWDPNRKLWNVVTPENKRDLDLEGKSFPSLFVPWRVNEDGFDEYEDINGNTVVLPKNYWPGIGNVSLTELIWLGQQRQLSFQGHDNLSLTEYTFLLMKNSSDLDQGRLDFYVNNSYKQPFVLPAVLEDGFFQDVNPQRRNKYQFYSYAFSSGDSVSLPMIANNLAVMPIGVTKLNDGRLVAMGGVRVIQGVPDLTVLNEFTLSTSGSSIGENRELVPEHKLFYASAYAKIFGGKNDQDKDVHPVVLFYLPRNVREGFLNNGLFPILESSQGILGNEEVYQLLTSEKSDSSKNDRDILLMLLQYQARLLAINSDFYVVNRTTENQ